MAKGISRNTADRIEVMRSWAFPAVSVSNHASNSRRVPEAVEVTMIQNDRIAANSAVRLIAVNSAISSPIQALSQPLSKCVMGRVYERWISHGISAIADTANSAVIYHGRHGLVIPFTFNIFFVFIIVILVSYQNEQAGCRPVDSILFTYHAVDENNR